VSAEVGRVDTGTVTEFDAKRGLGIVEHADGRRFRFHCIQIADGTRTIAVGTPVTYELAPGPLGEWEATAIDRA
jgi:CspA family cold shock protein